MGLRPSERHLNLSSHSITADDGSIIRMDGWLKMREFGKKRRSAKRAREPSAENGIGRDDDMNAVSEREKEDCRRHTMFLPN